MSCEIEASDVIRLIQQFLRENHLHQALCALHAETNVTLNTIDNREQFVQWIHTGQWDSVLQTVATLRLPPQKLVRLYEQVFREMLERREVGTARAVLRQTPPMDWLRQNQENRYVDLENILASVSLGENVLDLVPDKEARRAEVACELLSEIHTVPPQRLLTLLGEALQWEQREHALPAHAVIDIFRGIVPATSPAPDAHVTECYRTVQMEQGAHVETAAFSKDGRWFAVGLADGFVQLLDVVTGRVRTDLRYQQRETDMLVADSPILALDFSRDGEWLGAGTLAGDIHLWSVATGALVRRIAKAHPGGVSAVRFSADRQHVLSCGYDGAVRVHGTKNGTLLRTLSGGHAGQVNDTAYVADETQAASVGGDGNVRVWDLRTGKCLATVSPWPHAALAHPPIRSLVALRSMRDVFLAVSQTPKAHVFDARKQQFTKTCDDKQTSSVYVAGAISSGERLVYCASESGWLHCFDLERAQLEHSLELGHQELIGMAHHPLLNVLVSYDASGVVKFWRAPS